MIRVDVCAVLWTISHSRNDLVLNKSKVAGYILRCVCGTRSRRAVTCMPWMLGNPAT
jgi:hypothetical protein